MISTVFLLVMSFSPTNLEEFVKPSSFICFQARSESGTWWQRPPASEKEKCETFPSGEECGFCSTGTLEEDDHENTCYHIVLFWKYDIHYPHGRSDLSQTCKLMDHCNSSFEMQRSVGFSQVSATLSKMCSTVNTAGERVKTGQCRRAYGTYICECEKPYQGRNCEYSDSPEGAFATGVQVIMETKVHVSEMMTIMIAVKHRGEDLKVHIKSELLDTTITLTEPAYHDPSSEKLIKYCQKNTRLMDTHCDEFLKGSTSMYSVNLKFPLVRNRESVYYYDESTAKGTLLRYPIGYIVELTITTTNSINGQVIDSFNRTIYNRDYRVFVIYPVHIGCYENIRVLKCNELRKKMNIYAAIFTIQVHGKITDDQIPEVGKQSCTGYKTIRWSVSQVLPNGTFVSYLEHQDYTGLEYTIKPYSFKEGNYVVTITNARITEQTKSENFDQCFFTVVEAPLVAIIAEGRSRYVAEDTFTILDGSNSYDPNIRGEDRKLGLSYEWSCTTNDTGITCLESDMLGSHKYIRLPPSVLESQRRYIITLKVTKIGRKPGYTYQILVVGGKGPIQSMGVVCINCMEGNIANPQEFIYLLVKTVLKPNVEIEYPLNYTWTYSTQPVYPPETSTDSIRVDQTSQDLLKIKKHILQYNNTYWFRVENRENNVEYAEIDIRILPLEELTCSLNPDTGVIAVDDFVIDCSSTGQVTYEVYDKSSSDPNYFSGRMLYTDYFENIFKLARGKTIVYGYNQYKMIQEQVYEIKLSPFEGNLKDIEDMVIKLNNTAETNHQARLNSASVIPGALKPDMDWSSVSLLKNLISLVYQVNFGIMQYTKLVLSSLEFILDTFSKNDTHVKFEITLEEAKMCADIVAALANDLVARVENFEEEVTLTETILHQMIRSHLNVIEIVLKVKNAEVLSKPLYLVNPYVLYFVKDTTYKLVDALYKMSTCLLWRQIQGDSATEIISNEANITEWAMVNNPELLYHLRRQNQSIPFNFSLGFYETMKNLDVLGIQVTNLNVNPFWWAGGDINTNILLVDICFKVKPTQCKYKKTFYKAPIFLYFNISQSYNSLKPLEFQTVHLNLSKHHHVLDLDMTVYRFDPPLRAKLFIDFEFENSTDNYMVLFSINKRPDYEMLSNSGMTINNENQSSIRFVKYIKDDSDKLYYMGIVPLHEGATGKKANFKLKIVYVLCKTWLRWKWGSERCWVGEQETNEETLRCDCNHLSMFAGTVQVPSYTLNPAMEFLLYLTAEFNWLPLLVLIFILLIFIILYVWGWRQDRKDLLKGIVIVLEDNYPGESFAYLIGVYTGSRINSSTDANVGVKLFGENDKSRAHILKSSNRPILRGNSDDWFLLYSPVHLGTLQSLHIWHDHSGKSPDWFVEQIEVFDLSEKLKYIFELNIWLALRGNEYPEAVVAASSLRDFYSVSRVFFSNVVTGFRDINFWTSIFWKHARNPVKRTHRVIVVLSYIMVTTICSVSIYHFNKGEDYEEDEPSYSLNYTDLIVFVISLISASFTACLVQFLFRKSFSHRNVRIQSSLFIRQDNRFSSLKKNESTPQEEVSKNLANLSTVSLFNSTKAQFVELSDKSLNKTTISMGLRGKLPSKRSTYENFAAAVYAVVRGSSLEPVRLPKYRRNVILHKKYFITAWILFTVVSIGAAVVVIVFGHQLPRVIGEKWVTVFLSVLLFDALILSTLKILLCSIILGCVFQRLVPASNYQIKPEDGMKKELYGDINYLYKLKEIRSHPMYCPLSEKLKKMYRLKCVIREQWKLFFDFLVVLLLILVLVMLTFLYTVSSYSSNSHATWMLTKGPSLNYKNLTNIYNRTLYSEFLLHNFIHQLHRYLWYNQEDPLLSKDITRRKSWTSDFTMRLLGNARIRQLRVILGECSDVSYFKDTEEYCSPSWSSRKEDTGTYGSRWDLGRNADVRRKNTAWRYTAGAYSNSSASYGITLTVYPSGGYIEDLGFEKDVTEDALSSLIPQNWLDHMTRAVFLELTLYNVNTGLFSQVILIAEQMPTGEYLTAVTAESVTIQFSFDVWNISFGVFLIFFLSRMCVLMNRKGIFVYFSEIINVYELFLLILGLLTLFLYLIHVRSSTYYVQEFQRSGIDKFFNFFNIVFYISMSRTALYILFVCTVIRMFISWRFGRVFFTFYYTFLFSMSWIIWLVLYFILCLLVLRRVVGYLLNLFVFPYNTSLIIYHKDSSLYECEDFSYKVLVYLLCSFSYTVILLFIASFSYYYKVAKVFRLIDTDNLNYYVILKVMFDKYLKLNK